MAGPSYGNPLSRRRRQNAVDGSVPGTSPPRFHRGAHYSGTPKPGDLADRVVRVDLPHPSKEYDPVHPEYPDTPGYEPPDPWDAISLENPTPPLRLDWPERPEWLPSYSRSVAFARTIAPLIQEFLELRAAGEPIPAHLAQLYDSFNASKPQVVDSVAAGVMPDPLSPTISPEAFIPPMPGPELDELAIQMTGIPVEEMATDQLPQVFALGSDPAMPGLNAGTTEMSLTDMAEAMMPAADPPSSMDAPMMDLPGPIGDSPAMTLDAIVEQLMPEPAPPPEEPDPFMLMQNQFNQQMHLMDPFNMQGPMM